MLVCNKNIVINILRSSMMMVKFQNFLKFCTKGILVPPWTPTPSSSPIDFDFIHHTIFFYLWIRVAKAHLSSLINIFISPLTIFFIHLMVHILSLILTIPWHPKCTKFENHLHRNLLWTYNDNLAIIGLKNSRTSQMHKIWNPPSHKIIIDL
jgi:hypothetical protein